MIKTEIGFTTVDSITVRGRSLVDDLIGKIDFIDMLMLVILGRECQGNERDMLNTILVTVTDHGLTPSAVAARLTYTGAPEALQGAVAAGLLGAGSVFLGSMENAAIMLVEGANGLAPDATDQEVRAAAERLIDTRRAALALSGVAAEILRALAGATEAERASALAGRIVIVGGGRVLAPREPSHVA